MTLFGRKACEDKYKVTIGFIDDEDYVRVMEQVPYTEAKAFVDKLKAELEDTKTQTMEVEVQDKLILINKRNVVQIILKKQR